MGRQSGKIERGTFFLSPEEFAEWLPAYHGLSREIWVGFYKSKSKEKGMAYPQVLDLALCYGWIDAVRKSIDEEKSMIRFTARKPDANGPEQDVREADHNTTGFLIG